VALVGVVIAEAAEQRIILVPGVHFADEHLHHAAPLVLPGPGGIVLRHHGRAHDEIAEMEMMIGKARVRTVGRRVPHQRGPGLVVEQLLIAPGRKPAFQALLQVGDEQIATVWKDGPAATFISPRTLL
jgi:hypothetical protein